MDVEMELRNKDSNTSSKKKKKKRNKKTKPLGGGPSPSITANGSASCSGLMDDPTQNNMSSSLDESRRKGENNKSLTVVSGNVGPLVMSDLSPNDIQPEVPVDVSEPLSEKDLCVESTGNLGSCSALIDEQSNLDLNIAKNKKRKRPWKRTKALKSVNGDVDLQETVSNVKPNSCKTPVSASTSTHNASDKDFCVESGGKMSSSLDWMVQSNSDLSISEYKKGKQEKKEKLEASEADDMNVDLKNDSGTKTVIFKSEGSDDVSIKPEKDMPEESIDNISEYKKCKQEEEKNHKSSKDDITNVGLHKMVSETKTLATELEGLDNVSLKLVSKDDTCDKSTGNVSSSSGLIGVNSNSDLNITVKKKRKRGKKKKSNGIDINNKPVSLTGPTEVEVPDDLSKDTVAASMGMEAAISMNKKIDPITNLSRSKKKKLKAMDNRQSETSVGSEGKMIAEKDTTPTGVEVPSDFIKEVQYTTSSVEEEPVVNMYMSVNPVANLGHLQKKKLKQKDKNHSQKYDANMVLGKDKSATEVEVPHLSEEMHSIPSSIKTEASGLPNVEINPATHMNGLQQKKFRKRKRKQNQNSLALGGVDHVCLEHNALTNNIVLEKDTSLLSSAGTLPQKQLAGHISLCAEQDEVSYGHNTSEIKDVKLDLFGVEEDPPVCKKPISCSNIKDISSLLENHDILAANVNTSKREEKCKTDSEKKKIESSGSRKTTSHNITENAMTLASFDHAEAALVNSIAENKFAVLSRLKDDASLQVLEDAMMTEASIYCPDDKPVCKDNRMKMKEDGKNIEFTSRDKVNSVDVTGDEDNLQQDFHPLPKRVCISHYKKKLLVLDLNGILADIVQFPPKAGYKPHTVISRKAVFKRPYCYDFLRFCFERFNVGVWSSRIRKNVDSVVKFLFGDLRSKLLFVWDASHCTQTGLNTIENKNKLLVLKELKKLWDKLERNLPWRKGQYNEGNTLLLDDSPYKALRNPANTAIFPYSYKYKDADDSSLGPGGDLRVYLEGLAGAGNVQEYIMQNPFGQQAITESSPLWEFYSKILDPHQSQAHDTPSTSIAVSDVVKKMPLDNTDVPQAVSASEIRDDGNLV